MWQALGYLAVFGLCLLMINVLQHTLARVIKTLESATEEQIVEVGKRERSCQHVSYFGPMAQLVAIRKELALVESRVRYWTGVLYAPSIVGTSQVRGATGAVCGCLWLCLRPCDHALKRASSDGCGRRSTASWQRW